MFYMEESMKFTRAFACVLFCALLAVGSLFAGGGQASGPAAAAEDIQIGCLQDITGPTSSLGNMVNEGAKWAFNEINAAGGINGRKVVLVTFDTRGDVNEAINAFTRAATTGNVSAIIGPPVANIAMAIAPISERYNVPVLGFAVDTKCQIKADGTPYKNMFAFQPNADQQAEIMASYAVKNGFKRFGVLYNQGNSFSTSLLPAFLARVKAEGQTVLEPVPYNPQDRDFKTLL
jgi:branched-chain amino acid transport system substrate-binding protein